MADSKKRKTLALIFVDHFEKIEDPRIDRTKLHLLSDLLSIALCATLAGGTTWEDMQEWAASQEQQWLKESLGLQLPNGIPHHDTFARTL